MSPKTPHIQVVDGLRGLAILAVVYQHLYAGMAIHVLNKFAKVEAYIVGNGWMGVNLFFILSGFVLALPFFDGRKKLGAPHATTDFYRRRLMRLMPLLGFSALVISLFYFADKGVFPLRSFLLTVTTLNIFTMSEFFPTINAVYWTLSLEIWFSLLFPLILIAVSKLGMRPVLTGALVVALITRLIGSQIEWINPSVNPVKDSVPGRLDDFVVGIALAWLFVHDKLPAATLRNLFLGVVLVVLSALGWDLHTQNRLPDMLCAFYNNLTQGGFFLITAVLLQRPKTGYGFFTVKPLQILGVMCFSIYTWHLFIMHLIIDESHQSLVSHVMFWGALAVVSFASYHLIEFPQRLIARFRTQ